MSDSKNHQMIVHTKTSAIGHFTIEITGPTVPKGGRYVRGFGPEDDWDKIDHTDPMALSITGKVQNDAEGVKHEKFIASQPVAITRQQAQNMMAFVEAMGSYVPNYDLNDYNCVDFVNDVIQAGGLSGDVDDYLTAEQKADMNGAQFYNDWKYDPNVRPSLVTDPLSETANAFNRTINGAKYNGLMSELHREKASQDLLQDIARGSAKGLYVSDGYIDPSLGAAIMHGIEGRSMVGKTLPGGFSSLERTASERARAEYERSGSVTSAAQAAIDGLREAENYQGPSQDFSPEDTMTAGQLRDQLARSTAVREARARDLLGAPSITTSPVPNGAKVSAGSTNFPAKALSQSQYAALQDRLAATLGNRVAAQSVWQGTTPERSTTPDFHRRASEALDDLDSVLHGRTPALAQSRAIPMSHPTTPHLAGLFMDKPTVDRVMTSKAYTTPTNPLNSFATQAVKRFYGAAYADNKPDVPTRQTVAEEPSRLAAWVAVQKQTERRLAEQDREAQATQKARDKVEQAQAARTAKQAALSEMPPATSIEPHKLDTLGENAVSKAMGEQDAGLLTTKAQASITKDLLGAAWGLKSPALAALAARARSNERANDTGNNDGRSDQASKGPENLYSKGSAPEGSLGSPGYYDGNGNYHSGTNPGGAPTGGVTTDQYGREIGAYGQFTRDVVGRGDGSAAAGNTRVICTELVRQGLMGAELQRLDIAFTVRHLSPVTVRGYHVWAVAYVKLMKRSSLATHLIEPFARWRGAEIAYQMGACERPNWKGKGVRWVGEPLCWLLGVALGVVFGWGEGKTKGPGYPRP